MYENFSLPPLQDAKKQIRLLRFTRQALELHRESEIRCKISVHDINGNDLRYAAISYHWGSDSADTPRHVQINGLPFKVGYKCWYALEQIQRYEHRYHRHSQCSYYWIDSICIDQACHGEKSMQVAQMDVVFSRAERVMACVGAGGLDSRLFQASTYLKAAFEATLTRKQWRRWKIKGMPGISQRRAFFPFLALNEAIELVGHLVKRPYFRRLWIIQECVLARRGLIFCGSECIDLTKLMLHIRNLQADVKKSQALPDDTLNRWNAITQLSLDSCAYQAGHLDRSMGYWTRALSSYGDQDCFDPRDRIYGLLALAPDNVREQLVPDYTQSFLHAVMDFVMLVCRVEQRSRETCGKYSRAKGEQQNFLLPLLRSVGAVIKTSLRNRQVFREVQWLIDPSWSCQEDQPTWLQHCENQSLSMEIRGTGVHCLGLNSGRTVLKDFAQIYRPGAFASAAPWRLPIDQDIFTRYHRHRLLHASEIAIEYGSRGEGENISICSHLGTVLSHSHPLLPPRLLCIVGMDEVIQKFAVPHDTSQGDILLSLDCDEETLWFICRHGFDGSGVPVFQILGLAKPLHLRASLRSHPGADTIWTAEPTRIEFYLRDLLMLALVQQGALDGINLTVDGSNTKSHACLQSHPTLGDFIKEHSECARQ